MNWRHALAQKWAAVRFGDVRIETHGDEHAFEVEVYIDDLDPCTVQIELYADGIEGGPPVRQQMEHARDLPSAPGRLVFRGGVYSGRPPTDYTARAIPHRTDVATPLEDAHILWQR